MTAWLGRTAQRLCAGSTGLLAPCGAPSRAPCGLSTGALEWCSVEVGRAPEPRDVSAGAQCSPWRHSCASLSVRGVSCVPPGIMRVELTALYARRHDFSLLHLGALDEQGLGAGLSLSAAPRRTVVPLSQDTTLGTGGCLLRGGPGACVVGPWWCVFGWPLPPGVGFVCPHPAPDPVSWGTALCQRWQGRLHSCGCSLTRRPFWFGVSCLGSS